MIELSESIVLARQIQQSLAGREIVRAQADQTHHGFAWYTGDPAAYDGLLRGKRITGTEVVSGTLRVHAQDMLLVISTPVKLHAPGAKRPASHQLLLEFDDGSAITCTVQMWGCMFCCREDDPDGIPQGHVVNKQPAPTEDAFDWDLFNGLLAQPQAPELSAKAFLATAQRIPGLGNGMLQDILWTARIHPRRTMGSLSAQEKQDLFRAVKDVSAAMADQGGRDTERDLYGHPGGYRTVLSKKTVGQPCPACGETIVKEAYLGGSIYYCPGCQKR